MRIYPIDTGFFKLDGGAMFGVVPKIIWEKLYPADERNMIAMSMRCLLIEDGSRLILIDNGIGDKQDAKFLSHYYLHGSHSLSASLAKYGFGADDITDVLLTHLHFDHCGGSVVRQAERLVPAFRHATYWSNQRHWDWAIDPNDRERASFLPENILPLAQSGQLRMIPTPANPGQGLTNFAQDINIRFVFGHTEAMMLPQITYKDKTIVFVSDLIPTEAHLPVPYLMAYDMFPLTTLEEKKSFLQHAVNMDFILFFEHDPRVECCTLKLTEKGVRCGEQFLLAEI